GRGFRAADTTRRPSGPASLPRRRSSTRSRKCRGTRMVSSPRWKKRAQALVDGVHDVAPPGHPPAGRSKTTASGHRALFDRYVKALRKAKAEADGWRDGIIKAARSRGETQADAERYFKENYPVGTVAFGWVIAALRRFWLESDALNRNVDP